METLEALRLMLGEAYGEYLFEVDGHLWPRSSEEREEPCKTGVSTGSQRNPRLMRCDLLKGPPFGCRTIGDVLEGRWSGERGNVIILPSSTGTSGYGTAPSKSCLRSMFFQLRNFAALSLVEFPGRLGTSPLGLWIRLM
jgi:hypothetical protein